MKNKIQQLEKIARQLEPNSETRTKWNAGIQQYANRFLDNIEEIKAFVTYDPNNNQLPNNPISETPISMDKLLNILQQEIDTPGLNPASGGHLAYIPGGGVFATALGDYLADITNRYAGIFYAGPGAVRLENLLLKWMCEVVGFPTTAAGNLTSGGSIANLVAITTARDAKKIRARNIENSVIYLTHQAHHSVQKAIRIAGLNEAPLHYVPTDHRFRMDMDALQKMIAQDVANGLRPFLIIASAGTTDTGAIDPFDAIADLAQQYDMWFHIDGAYGGFFVLADEVKDSLKSMHKADSITIDPHKGLFLAYGCGAVLVKDIEALKISHYYQANYMQDAHKLNTEPSPADLSPELTKHFRGLRLWFPLMLHGLAPFKAALEEKIWLTRYFYQKIQTLGFEVGPYPELSVMIYRYVPKGMTDLAEINAFNDALVQYVKKDGTVFLSSTSIDGVYWLRLAVLCFRSHLKTVDDCLAVLESGVKGLLEG